jgi:PLP dependent protein
MPSNVMNIGLSLLPASNAIRISEINKTAKQVQQDNQRPAKEGTVSDVPGNFRKIHDRIETAAAKCGRAPGDILLLAISKTFPVEAISAAIATGQRRFGENRVQEGEAKIRCLAAVPGLEWHLVGHLQSNKAHRAVQLFDVIHSIDSAKIATKLNESCLELGKRISVLVQVDLGKEPTKTGVDLEEVRSLMELILPLRGMSIDGLMTIPPYFEDSELSRPYFAALRQLREALESERPGCLGKAHLSMGMSHDFEVAIQEGATIIRIGTSLFGERK